jgi:hypothetical protein
LILLGFAKEKSEDDVMLKEADDGLEEDNDALEGEVEISPLKLRRIVNLDEVNISLDGSNGNTDVVGLQLSSPTPGMSTPEKPSARLGKG